MAYLKSIKKKDKTYYYSEVQDSSWSKPFLISLKSTNDRKTALIRHAQIVKREPDIKAGIDFEFPWQKENGGNTSVKQFTINEAINKWLGFRKTEISKSTLGIDRNSLNKFMNVVGTSFPVRNISLAHIEDFKIRFNSTNAPNGINRNLASIRQFLNWSYSHNYINKIPLIKPVTTYEQKPKYISDSVFHEIMTLEAIDQHWRQAWKLYVTTGIRRAEVFNGYLDDNWLVVPPAYSKSRREREIELDSWQIEIVRDMQCRYKQCIDNGYNPKYFMDRYNKKFIYALKKIGRYEKGYSLHSLRHTYAIKRWLQTGDIYKVSREMGHSSITVTEQYASYNKRRIRKDFNSLELDKNNRPNTKYRNFKYRNSALSSFGKPIHS
jgi:site-specific recombinase XerD